MNRRKADSILSSWPKTTWVTAPTFLSIQTTKRWHKGRTANCLRSTNVTPYPRLRLEKKSTLAKVAVDFFYKAKMTTSVIVAKIFIDLVGPKGMALVVSTFTY